MSAAETRRFRTELGLLADVIADDIRPIARRADLGDIDRWWTAQAPVIGRIATLGWRNAAELAGRYLIADAAAEGVGVEPELAPASTQQIVTALTVAGPVAFKKNMALTGNAVAARKVMTTRLAGSAQRLALAGGRRTLMATISDSPQIIGFRRVTGPNPCDFCSMLAGRGAVYKTSDRAAFVVGGRSGQPRGSRRIGQSYHDYCNCSTEPIWG